MTTSMGGGLLDDHLSYGRAALGPHLQARAAANITALMLLISTSSLIAASPQEVLCRARAIAFLMGTMGPRREGMGG